MFLETGSILRKKALDDRQKDQLKILKRVNKELLQRLTQETNLSFGTVQLNLKKDLHFFSIVCLLCMKLLLVNKCPENRQQPLSGVTIDKNTAFISEPVTKIYLDFLILEKIAKKQKIHIFGSHSKKPCTPPFYIIFTSENHLNAHSSLIKPHMAMNFAPLDCPCQGASSESKKIYLDFFILEKIAKKQKIHIFGSHSKKWVQWPELLLYLNSTDPIQ
jgi:hypothetical protein